MSEDRDRPVRELSFGQRLRLAFAERPLRGLVVLFLLLLALGFLVAGVLEFWSAIVGALFG